MIFFVLSLRGLQGKPGSVVLKKDKQNLIGISIGGGAPLCPCLYVVQVFDNTPASRDGVLQAGDEIVGVNGKSLRGKTKVDVARAIQAVKVSFFIRVRRHKMSSVRFKPIVLHKVLAKILKCMRLS